MDSKYTEHLLRQLIALPSVNPAFSGTHAAVAGEHSVADFLGATAARGGLDVEFQNVFPGRRNLLARLSPAGRVRHRIWLVPHLDTVAAVNDGQFIPHRRNGRLYGRGACDTKASVAAMLHAVLELARARHRPRETEITFAGVVDEENAQAGSRALARGGLKAALAIVGEPTRLKVVTAHKGSLWLRLHTQGKSAHGARPELGRNAIHAMARIVDALETEYAKHLRRRRHPVLGCPTISVGTIHGGTQPNIVPDACDITIDRRTVPGETEAAVRREIIDFLSRRKLKAGFSNEKLAPCLPMETDPEHPWVRRFLNSAGQSKPSGVHFFCDAAVLSHAGIPSVVFGPGDIAQAHTSDEWISLASLERGTRMLTKFLRDLP
ncbi:MAG TPA: M20 family metallopeptidase [Verrucomicrobiae bacterium]|nr:M20 family metallopeptidase [Verrucomicrobiae bacterium]